MKFEAVAVDRFGCLRGLREEAGEVEPQGAGAGREPESSGGGRRGDGGSSSLPSLVVVLGPNESGKSTFFSFLTTLIYGFSPATRERHPHAPWDGGDAEGWARLSMDDGRVMVVRRRLKSVPWGKLEIDGRITDIRNRALNEADHVKRKVFGQVYAVSLSDLAAIEGESWDVVQDRLVGGLAARDLRPARDVMEALDAEAKRLWKKDKRGHPPLVRVLREELSGLNETRREAIERDAMLRATVKERNEAKAHLQELDAQLGAARGRCEVLTDRLQRLRPVVRALARIRELRADASEGLDSKTSGLAPLPPDPKARLAELRNQVEDAEERLAELGNRMAAAQETTRRYETEHKAVAEAEVELRDVMARQGVVAEMRTVAAEAQEAAGEAQRRCREHAGRVFSATSEDLPDDAVRSLSLHELRDRVEECERRIYECRTAERDALAGPPTPDGASGPGPARLAAGVGAIVAGLAAGVFGIFGSAGTAVWTAALVIGAGLVTAGTVAVLRWRLLAQEAQKAARTAAAAAPAKTRRVESARAAADDARSKVADALDGLPVLPRLLENPGPELLAAVERMAELIGDRDNSLEVARSRQRRLDEQIRERDRLAQSAGIDLSNGKGDPTLAAKLEAAVRAREEAKSAERDLEWASAQASKAKSQRNAAEDELRALEERLRPLGEGDADRGADVAASQAESLGDADRLEAELRREHPRLHEVKAEIERAEEGHGPTARAMWDGLDDALAEERKSETEWESTARELRETVVRLDSDIKHLSTSDPADEVAGQMEALRTRIAQAREERDRAFVLARIVETADRTFRDEHQPTLLRRAGEHLAHMTAGRYDQIELGDAGDESFCLGGPSTPEPRSLEGPLSQGTKEQAYLALRLAIVDHLDEGAERLPLMLDETLVNWDAERRERSFDLLERVSQNRQVFFFTVHEDMAIALEARGARIIALERAAA